MAHRISIEDFYKELLENKNTGILERLLYSEKNDSEFIIMTDKSTLTIKSTTMSC